MSDQPDSGGSRYGALVERLGYRWRRDRRLPLSRILSKAIGYGFDRLTAPFALRFCDRVGWRARTRARPVIENLGRIELGDDVLINSSFAPARLTAGPAAGIIVGPRAFINYGAEISAEKLVTLGHSVTVGPYVVISDHETHPPSGPGGDQPPSPVFIGDRVWLAARVRVTKGAIIGAGAVIAAGSVVSGEIPPGVVAGGIPARVLVPHLDGQRPTEPVADERIHARLHKWAHALSRTVARALSPLYLRPVSGLGRRPYVRGVPYIDNLGKITIGDDFRLYSRPVRSHFVTGPNGSIEIGNGVSIGSGAAIASDARIQIGDGVQLGCFVMIMDTDFHDIRDISAPSAASPVVIEYGVQLGSCVTVLKGAHIGRNAQIGAGSVVRGTIPAGAFACGVPARVLPAGQP